MNIYERFLSDIPEKLMRNNKGVFMIDSEVSPRENHQIWEDILKKQKEFACEIYLQRDKEKHL